MSVQGSAKRCRSRRGAILVLSAFLLIVLASITALVVDVGFLKVTKTHLQSGADAAALAGVSQLPDGLGLGAIKTPAQAAAAARTVAVQYAGYHRNGDLNSSYADANRDVEIGNAIYNANTSTWNIQVGVAPYNMARVTLRRDQVGSANGDRPLPLFFAGALGRDAASLRALGAAAMLPGSTFQIPPGSPLTASILPFAFEKATWDALASGPDNFKYDPATGAITSGQSDGVKEINLYPNDTGSSGNSGTVRIGIGNSTSALGDQIRYGISANDLVEFGGQLTASPTQPLLLGGNPGISTAIKADLETVVGQARTIALYTTVSGPGNNAVYTIVKFVPIRILQVKLTGNPKRLWAQPAVVVDPTIVPDPTAPITSDSVFASPVLIQ
jgi:Flp pilus assembly protein TadG